MRAFGFLSFGHYGDVRGSAVRTAGDMLNQTIELAEGADEIGVNGAYVRAVVSAFRKNVDAVLAGQEPALADLVALTEGRKQTEGAFRSKKWR